MADMVCIYIGGAILFGIISGFGLEPDGEGEKTALMVGVFLWPLVLPVCSVLIALYLPIALGKALRNQWKRSRSS